MWRRVFEIFRKELRQALREPKMRVVLIGPPLIQLIIFGYAVNLDVNVARIAWMDADHTVAARDLRAAFDGSGHFQIVANPEGEREAQQLLDRGDVQAVIGVLPNFGRDIERGHTARVQVLVDGTDSNTASIVSSYTNRVIADYAGRRMVDQQRSRLVARTMTTGAALNPGAPSVDARTRVWFNPDLLSRNYFVPGVVVNIVTLVTIMMTAMAIVREKEIGTMEQLMVSPIKPFELMLGKTLPFALAGFLEVILITAAALIVFGIPFRGSALLLLVCSALFLLSTVGVGLFVSTVSSTQQQAVMGAFFFFAPAFMLSGFAFPIRNMPIGVQALSYLDPLRYFISIVRGIFLKGTGIPELWPHMLALLVYGALIMGASALRFHKRLD